MSVHLIYRLAILSLVLVCIAPLTEILPISSNHAKIIIGVSVFALGWVLSLACISSELLSSHLRGRPLCRRTVQVCYLSLFSPLLAFAIVYLWLAFDLRGLSS